MEAQKNLNKAVKPFDFLDENYNWDLVNELSKIDDLEELETRHKVVMQDLSQKIYDTAILYRMIANMDNEGD